MPKTKATTIMTVDLSVDPTRRNQFDSFYHNFYIPEFLKAVPEILTARRYSQKDLVAKLDPATTHFLTIYELATGKPTDIVEDAIARSAHQEASNQFKVWKEDGLTYFERAFYREIYRHSRQPEDGCFGKRSLYIIRWTEKGFSSGSAKKWYGGAYLDQMMDNVPDWLACRTYLRMHFQPASYLTVFEAKSHASLLHAVASSDDDWSDAEQANFRDWLQNGLTWHDCLMLEPIYFLQTKEILTNEPI
jgi:hypothetical protein